MAKSAPVISRDTREKLVELIKADPKFREKLKSDWKGAFKDAGVDPAAVKGKVLEATDLQPFGGDAVTSGIHITIHIMAAAGLDRIDLRDSVTFDQ